MIFAQRSRSGVPLDEQSVVPTVPGVPWWGAVVIATGLTIVGALFGTGVAEMGTSFKGLYVAGAIIAVLAVRRKALFTAVAQTPLVLFGVAFIALFLKKPDNSNDLKAVIFNVLLPIAKMFPLMGWTFVVVLAMAVARWFIGKPLPALRRPERAATSSREKAANKNAPAKSPAAKVAATKSPATKVAAAKTSSAEPAAQGAGGRAAAVKAKRSSSSTSGAPAGAALVEPDETTALPTAKPTRRKEDAAERDAEPRRQSRRSTRSAEPGRVDRSRRAEPGRVDRTRTQREHPDRDRPTRERPDRELADRQRARGERGRIDRDPSARWNYPGAPRDPRDAPRPDADRPRRERPVRDQRDSGAERRRPEPDDAPPRRARTDRSDEPRRRPDPRDEPRRRPDPRDELRRRPDSTDEPRRRPNPDEPRPRLRYRDRD